MIDASVAFKWVVEEPDSDLALLLSTPEVDAIAPDFLPVEIAHGLRGRFVRGLMSEPHIAEASARIPTLSVELFPSGSLMISALEFAIRYRSSVYDAVYAVLALQEVCPYITADRKFYEATARAFPETMVFIDQIPELLS